MSVAKKTETEQAKFAPNRINAAAVIEPDRAGGAMPAPRTAGAMAEQFPTEDLQAKKKPEDELMEAKLALGDGRGNTPFGKMTYSDRDAQWLIEKQKAAEKAEFEMWFAKNFDKMGPAEKKWAREHYPEFYAARQRVVKQQAENLVKLATLKLHGVRSYDDLMTQYLAETGRLDIGAVQHILNPEDDVRHAEQVNAAFKRGLLSPFRVFGEEALPQSVATREDQAIAYQGSFQPDSTGLGVTSGIRIAKDANAGFEQWYDRLAAVGQ